MVASNLELGIPERLVLRQRIGTAALLITGTVIAATACAGFARHFWIADLATHFRLQYVGAALFSAFMLAWARRPLWTLLALAACAINLSYAAPVLRASPESVAPAAGRLTVRAATINVFYLNKNYLSTIHFVRHERPDFVALQEVTARWHEALGALTADYPYQHFTGDAHARGVLLLSRYPLEHAESLRLHSEPEPSVLAIVNVRGQTLRLVGVHASWPMGPANAARRNRQLLRLAEIARSHPTPLLVLGDLNISPFSPHFQGMLGAGGLRSAAQGFGWQPTWPSLLPLAGMQIDHALVTRDLGVRHFERGPFIGSDHRPVIVEIALR